MFSCYVWLNASSCTIQQKYPCNSVAHLAAFNIRKMRKLGYLGAVETDYLKGKSVDTSKPNAASHTLGDPQKKY